MLLLLTLLVLILGLFRVSPHIQSVPADFKPLKIAICLTGQLARLELLSKVRNVLVPNAVLGHNVHVFILLDGNTSDVKQTFWKFNYTDNVYSHMKAGELQRFVELSIDDALKSSNQAEARKNIVVHEVKLQPPSRNVFPIRGSKIPVTDKSGPTIDPFGSKTVEPANIRFQNNMRWLSAMRDCVKLMQSYEVEAKVFFDIVIRMRDDTFALRPWLFDPLLYKGHLVSLNMSVHFGINDHNFSIDRKWADRVMRGVTEDYYFNKSLDIYSWVNPERRIYKVSSSYRVPMAVSPFCEHPLIPLRGKLNSTHWRVHVTYTQQVLMLCMRLDDFNKWRGGKRIVSVTTPPKSKGKGKKPRRLEEVIENDRVGIRPLGISNMYTYEQLVRLMMRNRALVLAAKKGKTSSNVSHCCSHELIEAMKAQAVPIENLYDFSSSII